MPKKIDHSSRIAALKASRGQAEDAARRSNKRRAERISTFKNGELIVQGGRFKCVVRDLTADGAMLTGTGIHNINVDTAELIIDTGHRHVRIAWREIDCIGVNFIGAVRSSRT